MKRQVARAAVSLALVLLCAANLWALYILLGRLISESDDFARASIAAVILGLLPPLAGIFKWLWKKTSSEHIDLIQTLRVAAQDEAKRAYEHMLLNGSEAALQVRLNSHMHGLESVAARMATGERFALVGARASGKSFAAVKLAWEYFKRTDSGIAVVVSTCSLDIDKGPSEALSRYVSNTFGLPLRSVRQMVNRGDIFPIIDGLDETERQDRPASNQIQHFLGQLLSWHRLGRPQPFVITSRTTFWRSIDPRHRGNSTLHTCHVMPLSRESAEAFVGTALTSLAVKPDAARVLSTLSAGRNGGLRPWQLALLVKVIELRNAQTAEEVLTIAQFTGTANLDRLVEQYFVAWSGSGSRVARLRKRRTLRILTIYARYLCGPAFELPPEEYPEVSGEKPRILVVHRLWPIAGRYAPRVVDLLISLAISLPAILWALMFVSIRQPNLMLPLMASLIVYFGLLLRTSLKPWVPLGLLSWERITQRKFAIRQAIFSLTCFSMIAVAFGILPAFVVLVSVWLTVGLAVGFGQTLTSDDAARAFGPLGILNSERLVSALAALAGAPVICWGAFLTWGGWGLVLAVLYCVLVGLTVASAIVRRHLAMILCTSPRLPLLPGRFLKRQYEAGFLRASGTAFEFRHAEFLRYFANASAK